MTTTTLETTDWDRAENRSGLRRFYAAAAIAGTVIPWIFFGSFLAAEGGDLIGFLKALFPNGAAGGFSADIFISAAVFWVWSYRDARTSGVDRWWLVVPATLFVGLSLAFPLYLYRREVASVPGLVRPRVSRR